MTNAYVLMTALPPTKGHAALIEFASLLPQVGKVHVIVCTQPSEPFSRQRVISLDNHFGDNPNVIIHGFHREISQDASKPEFWEMWREIMLMFKFTADDVIVSSESYGQKVADLFGAKFMPYDPARELLNIKATNVRKMPLSFFDRMIPEFQQYLTKTITFFGAESVGKTEMSRALAFASSSHWRFEYARPYLEMVGSEITDQKMTDIWHGQKALQDQAILLDNAPFVVQDTDLFSTVGYWEMWNPDTMPTDLLIDAREGASDLYIILSQNIPFEPDPLRYGGDVRESTDQYWVDLCEREDLNYVYIDEGGNWEARLNASFEEAREVFFTPEVRALQTYERKHNG